MAIPEVPEFERFLSSLSLNVPGERDGCDTFEVIGRRLLFDGRRYALSHPVIGSYALGEMALASASTRLQKELRNAGHVANEAMVRLLLGMSAVSRPDTAPAVSHLNRIISAICQCDFSMFVIAAAEDGSATRKTIGHFHVGPIDSSKLTYRCKRVGCDYFDRYPNAFSGTFCVERDPLKVQILDFSAVPPALPEYDALVPEMQDEYFQLVTMERFRDIAVECEEETLVVGALGGPVLNLRELLALDGSLIGIFQNLGARQFGHFRPIGARSLLRFHPPESEIARVQASLRERFSFTSFNNSELHQSFKSFAKLIVRARQHRANGSIDEAFLHCVIAFESLFGDRDALARSLANRLAVVTAGRLGKRFSELSKLVADLYDSRSKYVHRGQPVPEEHVEAVWPMVEATIQALLRLQAVTTEQSLVSIESWLKKLDFLASSLAVGEPPPDNKFVENGLVPPPQC